MINEEAHERNAALKRDNILTSRSYSLKPYLGCDTCKLKSLKSLNKLSESVPLRRNKGRIPQISRPKTTPSSRLPENYPDGLEECEEKSKVKLTDLCDEDKRRLVLLIQELSVYADRNERLQEEIDTLIKTNQEQQAYIIQQANSFTEEKKIQLNEINQYKSRIESLESELKNAVQGWKNEEKKKNDKIHYLSKVLKKTLREKKDLHDEMNNLKISLQHSLESFQKLKSEVTELQFRERELRCFKSVSSQTECQRKPSKEELKHLEEETEEDYISVNNQSIINPKSSIDVGNDPVEFDYRVPRKEHFSEAPPGNCELELISNWKNDNNGKTSSTIMSELSKTSLDDQPTEEKEEISSQSTEKSGKFKKHLEPLLESSDENQPPESLAIPNETMRYYKNFNFLQNKFVQENSIFKEQRKHHQLDEDKLLEELFYSEQGSNLEYSKKLKNKKWVSYLSNFTK